MDSRNVCNRRRFPNVLDMINCNAKAFSKFNKSSNRAVVTG